MTIQEWAAPIVEELFDGIDSGVFSDSSRIPDKYTYKHLIALFYLADYVEGGKSLYREIFNFSINYGRHKLKEKLSKGEKIRIVFMAISAAEWPAQKLFEKLAKLDWVEISVLVCPLQNRSKENMEYTYEATCRFFDKYGYQVKKAYDNENKRVITWEENGGIPDIIVHLSSWYNAVPKEYWLDNIPLCCLNCYIPYGIFVVDSQDGNYLKHFVYNKEFMNLMWKIYTDSEQSLRGFQQYQLLKGENVRYFGYSKMDYFYQLPFVEEEEVRQIWKISKEIDCRQVKKVIIAPHHSIKKSAGLLFATFAQNMYFWIYLVKKYEGKIHFVYKPHPNLRARAVEAGLFENEKEYDNYIDLWNSLPNAKVVEEDDYLDIFATSDGMIMDSCSFIAEYTYTQKPMLFLTRNGQAFSPLGLRILEGYYQVPGNAYWEIEKYLQEVVLEGKDKLAPIRQKIWSEEMDYLRIYGQLANDSIYEDILDDIFAEENNGIN